MTRRSTQVKDSSYQGKVVEISDKILKVKSKFQDQDNKGSTIQEENFVELAIKDSQKITFLSFDKGSLKEGILFHLVQDFC